MVGVLILPADSRLYDIDSIRLSFDQNVFGLYGPLKNIILLVSVDAKLNILGLVQIHPADISY